MTTGPPSALRVHLLWLLSRLLVLVLSVLPAAQGTFGDISIYHRWADDLWSDGVVPGQDFDWEYPPGAGVLLLPTALLGPAAYFGSFLAGVLALDLLVLRALLRSVRTTGSTNGVTVWVLGVLLLGPVALTRFDLVPSALATLGLVAAPAWSGALLALAATSKLWPAGVLVLVLLSSRTPGRVLRGAGLATAAVAALAAATGLLPSAWTSVQHQLDRGVQVESLWALPALWSRAVGDGPAPLYVDNAWEVDSHLTELVATAATAVTLVLVVLLLRRARNTPTSLLPLLAAELVGVLILTDKVFSPQYLLWLLPFVALAASRPELVPRTTLVLLLAACALTQAVYPFTYTALIDGGVVPLLLLTVRDALLVAAVVGLSRARRRAMSRAMSDAPQPGAVAVA